ncbi:GntR family transcriptional regulator [Bacilliculturomica massiliensis]|uniref:GntR family transcriptional regulator n=1 Tax=Bacilliculturomica massiliensis TaxID=1917867 RepID=UPI0013EEFFA9|nr:GntR family transcriptional regulator [Bacilliculturomica massiliensis]
MSNSIMNGGIMTITEQIYNLIRTDILTHNLKAGEKLTMKFLQERLGVSSSPIREALTRLQQEGLIEYQPNVGMSVMVFTAKDVEDIFALMQELECVALRFACRSEDRAGMIQDLRRLQDKASRRLQDGELEQWEDLSNRFHMVFYSHAGNARLSDAATKTRTQLSIFSNLYQKEPENQLLIHQEHEQILQLLEAGDDAAAEEALRRHMDASKAKAIAQLHNEKI